MNEQLLAVMKALATVQGTIGATGFEDEADRFKLWEQLETAAYELTQAVAAVDRSPLVDAFIWGIADD